MTDLIERPDSDEAAAPPPEETAPVFKPTRRRRRDYGAMLGAAWIGVVVIAAITANWLPLPDPNEVTDTFSKPPSWGSHLLGTDSLGRDTLSRCIFGARVSMAVAIGGTAMSLVIGVALGMIAGYFRGAKDGAISLLINFLLAFPPLIFLIALVAALRPNLSTLVFGLALLGIPNFARVARATTIAFAEREFVTAAKALGARPVRILTRELLVNVMLPVMSLALVVMATLVVAEGSLSFLGLGVPPPTPSWGGMLAAGRESLSEHPHLMFVPALFFFLTVFSFNRLGDWARGRVGRESSL
ncbi:peptide/nickel transport system permease protein [Kribbella sp. VKM Ac-2527]|uniref:Peptide/nickel transport system permease protein n=1 Tax=Kribbella caucasensis TaxID=2512215 RepID=A0A4V6PT30_9ACTN|nr:ABC transporter permease [Kribbella sp. VKM Ac-2527]TDO46397.1 peptide/nickel transport system permease protein [Kribbella sp. VKM Ac-2527]